MTSADKVVTDHIQRLWVYWQPAIKIMRTPYVVDPDATANEAHIQGGSQWLDGYFNVAT